MRIAFIAPYQGPTLVKRRPVMANLSLGNRTKIELIAELLQNSEHSVELFSQGEVVIQKLTVYPSFKESEQFHKDIPVYYSSAFPVRFLNGFVSSSSTLRRFKARHRVSPFDLVFIYNLKPPQISCANYAINTLGLPVVLDYEDDFALKVYADSQAGMANFRSSMRAASVKKVLSSVSGCISGSHALMSQVPGDIPRYFLPGVVGQTDHPAANGGDGRNNWVVFTGTHSPFQGLEQLIQAWKMSRPTGWQLHIAGQGEITGRLQELAQGDSSIVFHGVLNRKKNLELLVQGRISVVAYEVSKTLGFSFKTLECLGAGLHVITTPLTALETLDPAIKSGLTYIPDNKPETIASALREVIADRRYQRSVQEATLDLYGPAAVARELDRFVTEVASGVSKRNGMANSK